MLSGPVTVNGGDVLHVSADNVLVWDNMRDEATQLWVEDATVSASTTDSDGNAVSGVDDVTMSHVSGGLYRGVMDATDAALLTEGDVYSVAITATSGTSDGYRVIDCVARYRDKE